MAKNQDGKQGFTVQEIENVAKKYKFEAFFCLSFLLAALFSYIWKIEGWSIFICALGGVIGMLVPQYTEKFMGFILGFTCKQEKVTQIVIGVILLVLSVLIAPVVFLFLGLMGGKSIHKDTAHHKGLHLHGHLDETHKE
ncbi:MAG: hypothetical protein K9M07_01065 [Simkaniaceae bacterium]|nr:hypothetical protein [Simkaniaceae bacterium]MCF7851813.1 hypothetical protein [Simkaniaceae bacterium]